jgi:hypothetical protein
VEQNYDRLTIIVSDNVSQDDTEAVAHSFADPRLRYVKTPRRLSMTGNYEFALSHAQPGLVAIIGDDDGLMPGAVARVADIVMQTKAEAISGLSVLYAWPSHLSENTRNRMYFPKVSSKIEEKDPRRDVATLISYRGGNVRFWHLPMIYHGFVSTSVIERAKRNGEYFHSITPDVYASIANAMVVEKFFHISWPLTIEGSSGRSIGASQSSGISGAEEAKFLGENDLSFHSDLVYAPSLHILIAEAYLQVQERFPDACKEHEFDISRICGAALRDASGANKDRIIKAVNEILAKHNVAAEDPHTVLAPVTTAWKRFIDAFAGGEVDCTVFGVRDVYHASLLADHLLRVCYGGEGVSFGILRVLQKLTNKILPSRNVVSA